VNIYLLTSCKDLILEVQVWEGPFDPELEISPDWGGALANKIQQQNLRQVGSGFAFAFPDPNESTISMDVSYIGDFFEPVPPGIYTIYFGLG
jgi:hypothetical protein